jgi:hypothetical protein
VTLQFHEVILGHRRTYGEWRTACVAPHCNSRGTVYFNDGTSGTEQRAFRRLVNDGWHIEHAIVLCPVCCKDALAHS